MRSCMLKHEYNFMLFYTSLGILKIELTQFAHINLGENYNKNIRKVHLENEILFKNKIFALSRNSI